MAKGKFGSPNHFVIFAGQSLVNVPAAGTTFAAKVMSGRGIGYRRLAENGSSWTDLYGEGGATQLRCLGPYAKSAASVGLVMCGGQSDLWAGDSGAQVYADAVVYADAARSLGVDWVMNMTIPPNSVNDGGQETARQDHNTALLLDADDAFEQVIDVAADPSLDDHTDTTYYGDGVHWTSAATTIVAALLDPYLDAVLV